MRGQDNTPEAMPHVSASQVDAFTKCERAWFYDKVLGVPRPQTGAQGKGVAVHAALEASVKHINGDTTADVEIDEEIADIIAPLWQLITPQDMLGAVSEVNFRIPTYENGPEWVGYIDLHFPGTNPLRISDYKTTSDLRYAKTPEQLAQDVQMISYGKWAMDHYPGIETVRLQHIYLVTRGKPKAKIISVDVNRPQVLQIWERDVSKVRRMDALRVALPDPQDVAPTGVDSGQCTAYGGCPYRERCGLVPTTLSAAFKKALTPAGENPMDTATPALSPLLAKIQALRNKNTTAPPVVNPAPAAPLAPPVAVVATPAVGVVPPDAPPREQAPVTVETPIPVPELEAKLGQAVQAVAESRAGTDADIQERVRAIAAETAEPKRGRGRPPGAKNTPKETIAPPDMGEVGALLASAHGEIERLRAELAAAKAVPERTTVVSADQGLTLYVDCFPVKGPDRDQAVLLDEWLAPIAQAVGESNGVADYRLLQYHAPKVALTAGIKAVRDSGTMPRVLCIATGTLGAEVALEALTPFAKRIIRRA